MVEGSWDVGCPMCWGEENKEDCLLCNGSGKEGPGAAIRRIKNYFQIDRFNIEPSDVEILIKAGEELERRAENNLELARHPSRGELAF